VVEEGNAEAEAKARRGHAIDLACGVNADLDRREAREGRGTQRLVVRFMRVPQRTQIEAPFWQRGHEFARRWKLRGWLP